MKDPKMGPHANARVWALIALKAASYLIPIIQRELKKRWKTSSNKEKNP